MERELAVLSPDDEEDEIVEVQKHVELVVNENEFCLVGCFLTASVIHFLFMKNEFGAGYYEASWMFNNHLLVFHQLFLREDPLKSGHNDSFSQARMALGIEVVKMGWDLTLKAQFSSGRWSWVTEERMDNGIRIDPMLGLNLEGDQTIMSLHKNDPSKPLGLIAMDHDLEKLILEGWDVLEIFLYRRLPRGILTSRNENDKLKCLRVEEPSSYAKTSLYAEVA
ncbi:hypothetical protein Golob_012763 [Gossypium lobatum]|uniref:Uncharacterized protein n=1 Tax=Gossypium lobatum TaxID=34289 RepID=A0A7J8LMH5_9ROSI|nr:hypothetical protein [Gossypium lobatum]